MCLGPPPPAFTEIAGEPIRTSKIPQIHRELVSMDVYKTLEVLVEVNTLSGVLQMLAAKAAEDGHG